MKSSDVTDLYIDQNRIHPEQRLAEERAKNYILIHASNQKSYLPIKFGNLASGSVYNTDNNYSLDSIRLDLKEGNTTMFEEILNTNTNTKQKLDTSLFLMPHTYELIDNKGARHRCLSSITFDNDINVISISNDEDWILKFWNEKNRKCENWNDLFNDKTNH